MACMLRLSVRRSLGETILEARPFGRREMFEGGGPDERGKGTRMGLDITIGDREWFDFRGQRSSASRFPRRYEKPLRLLTADARCHSAGLDFGVGDAIDGGRGPAVISYYRLPADLVTAAGELSLHLEVSIYPVKRRMTKRGLR